MKDMPKSINFSKIFTGSFKSPEGKPRQKTGEVECKDGGELPGVIAYD